MSETSEKKGMSKGCMIALIVGLVVIIIIAGLTIWCISKKEEIIKLGTTTAVNGSKSFYAQHPEWNLDTAVYNAMVDSFLVRFEAETPLDSIKSAEFIMTLQSVFEDKEADSSEYQVLIDAMVEYYPEIAPPADEMIDEETVEDTAIVNDSM